MLITGMNSIVATGLLNIGKEIIKANFPGLKSSPDSASQKQFSAHLTNAESKQLAGKHTLQSIESSKKELLSSPIIQKFLSKNAGCEITLDQLANGSFRCHSSSGEFIIIEQDSEFHQSAKSFFELSLKHEKNLANNRLDAVLLTT